MEIKYKVSDLNYGTYTYSDCICWFDECGDSYVNVYGERSGMIVIKNGEYYDLIADCVVSEKNIKNAKSLEEIIKDTSLQLENTMLTKEQIVQLTKRINEELGYQSYEEKAGGGYGDTATIGYIPSYKAYDSTEEKQGVLKREFHEYDHCENYDEYFEYQGNGGFFQKIKSLIPRFKK